MEPRLLIPGLMINWTLSGMVILVVYYQSGRFECADSEIVIVAFGNFFLER